MNPAFKLIIKVYSVVIAVGCVLGFLFTSPTLKGVLVTLVALGVAIALWRRELFE